MSHIITSGPVNDAITGASVFPMPKINSSGTLMLPVALDGFFEYCSIGAIDRSDAARVYLTVTTVLSIIPGNKPESIFDSETLSMDYFLDVAHYVTDMNVKAITPYGASVLPGVRLPRGVDPDILSEVLSEVRSKSAVTDNGWVVCWGSIADAMIANPDNAHDVARDIIMRLNYGSGRES